MNKLIFIIILAFSANILAETTIVDTEYVKDQISINYDNEYSGINNEYNIPCEVYFEYDENLLLEISYKINGQYIKQKKISLPDNTTFYANKTSTKIVMTQVLTATETSAAIITVSQNKDSNKVKITLQNGKTDRKISCTIIDIDE